MLDGDIKMIITADYILTSITLIWLTAACITDLKKREVANWLSFSLIAIALGMRAIASISVGNGNYFLYDAVRITNYQNLITKLAEDIAKNFENNGIWCLDIRNPEAVIESI